MRGGNFHLFVAIFGVVLEEEEEQKQKAAEKEGERKGISGVTFFLSITVVLLLSNSYYKAYHTLGKGRKEARSCLTE